MAKAGAVAISDDNKPVMNAHLMRLAMEYSAAFGPDGVWPLRGYQSGQQRRDELKGYNSTLLGLRGITRAAEEGADCARYCSPAR